MNSYTCEWRYKFIYLFEGQFGVLCFKRIYILEANISTMKLYY